MATTPTSLINRLMGAETWTDSITFATGKGIVYAGTAPTTIAANTAAAWTVTDAVTNILAVDSRNTVTAVAAFTVTASPPTIAGASGTTFSQQKIAALTLTDSTQTLITALNGLGLYIDIPTVAQSGGAVTVTTISNLFVDLPVAGASVTATNIYTAVFNGNLNMSAGATIESLAANTASASIINDGTTAYQTIDTRNTVTGVIANKFAASAPTITAASGVTYTVVGIPAITSTLTGATGVTALAGLQLLISSPTVTDSSGVTVTTASAVQINGPLPAGSVTFTNSFALDIPTFATNGTTAAGLRVAAPTAATTNLGIQITSGGMTCAGGLTVTPATAAAITTTRALTAADSGGTFTVAKTSAYAITLPTAAQGLKFKFMVLDTGANAVTISDGAAHLNGLASVGNTNTAMTGTTISLVATGAIGDWVSFEGIDATHYLVTGGCVTAGKITVA